VGDVTLVRRALADVPADDDWLTDRERAVLAGLRFEKRRADWRLGRFTAKHAVASFCGVEPHAIAIIADDDGAPHALGIDGSLPASISITHRDGVAVCAVGEAGVALGCDLELVEARPAVFAGDWFTAVERARVDATPASRRDHATTLVWATKEAAMKARHDGLRVATQQVVVEAVDEIAPAGSAWRPLRLRWEALPPARLHGWWTDLDRFVLAVVADPPPSPPVWR
jgi:4'-phosphopantetheinyl transferase